MHNYKGLSVSIEIGASAVKVLAAEFDEEINKLQFVAKYSAPYPEKKLDVVVRGEIHDPISVETALKEALDYLDSEDCNLSEAHYYFVVTGNSTNVGIQRYQHNFQETSRISQSDLDLADNELSKTLANPDTEIIYNSPRVWYIEDQEKRIILGHHCRSFVQENLLVYASSKLTNDSYNIIAAITAHNPSYYTYSPIATAVGILNEAARTKGSLVINIGEEVTEYCLFHNGVCNHAGTVVVGTKHIANDLAIGLEIDYPTGKKILIKLGNALETVGSSERQVEFEGKLYKKNIIEVIINLRLNELIGLIKSELNEKKLLAKITHAIFLTGGGAQIPEINILVKDIFRNIPVQQGRLELDDHRVELLFDQVDANAFSTVAGLAVMGHSGGDQDENSSLQMLGKFLKNSIDGIKQFLKGDKS